MDLNESEQVGTLLNTRDNQTYATERLFADFILSLHPEILDGLRPK